MSSSDDDIENKIDNENCCNDEAKQATQSFSENPKIERNINESEPMTKRVRTNSKTQQWHKPDFLLTHVPSNKFEAKELENVVTPLDFFCMVGSEFFNTITDESNRYLDQSTKYKVKYVTTEEVRRFIEILMYMSIVRLPQRRMYWSSQLRQENIADHITCNRFEEILMIFNLSDNKPQSQTGLPNLDGIFKVKSFLGSLQENFKKHLNPETHMCVDEQMISLKMRHPLKNKSSKWGYKVWVLAGLSGYIHDFQISDSQFDSNILAPDETEKLDQIIIELTKSLSSGAHLYFDNYFASPLLLSTLKEKSLWSTCTIMGGKKRWSRRKNEN